MPLMNYSYDYTLLIEELEEDIQDGLIKNDDILNIVRGDNIKFEDCSYNPIIDYYTIDDLENLLRPLEFSKNRDEYSDDEWNELVQERGKLVEQYKNDEPHFEKMSVFKVLKELQKWNATM